MVMTLSTCYTSSSSTVIFPDDKTAATNIRNEVNLIRTRCLGKTSKNFKNYTQENHCIYCTHLSWIVNKPYNYFSKQRRIRLQQEKSVFQHYDSQPTSGCLTSGSRPGQAVPSPFCQRTKDEGKLRPKFTKCEKINIFEHTAGFRSPVAAAKPKWRQIQCLAMSPLRKGSRCHAPALCLSQWRGWVYVTFHLWDKENHRLSCNGGSFSRFPCGWFWWINRRWRNFNYANCEVLDLPVGGTKKKENTEVFAVLPSWNDEKEERFLRQKVTVMTWKMVEKIWILSKNIFGESLTKCAPSGHEKTIINRKSREPFFKYGSLTETSGVKRRIIVNDNHHVWLVIFSQGCAPLCSLSKRLKDGRLGCWAFPGHLGGH